METWNVESLKEYFDQRFNDSDKAIQAALASQEKAVIKAENAADKRFELLNELRDGVATREQLDALEKIVNSLASRLSTDEGSSQGSQITKTNFYGAIGAAGVLLSIVVLLANGLLK